MSDLAINTSKNDVNTYTISAAGSVAGTYVVNVNGLDVSYTSKADDTGLTLTNALSQQIKDSVLVSRVRARSSGSVLAITPVDFSFPILVTVSNNLNLSVLPTTPGDLLLSETGDLILTSGSQAVLQSILQRLSLFAGEWFLDVRAGIDWYSQILVKNPIQSNIDAIFISTILATPGVLRLLDYSFNLDSERRSLLVRFTCLTVGGDVEYQGSIQATG